MKLFTVTTLLLCGAAIITSSPGDPSLVLTPYILKNQTATARNLSVVDSASFLNVTSYSGYLTVNEVHNSNLFFWYFPAANRTDGEKTPWIIWLQGGPGVSSLAGLFDEIGPFSYNKTTGSLKLRQWSWHQKYSLLFIDNPVGAGFSFTSSPDGYVRGMDDCSEQLYIALQQFLEIFPEHRAAPLYLAGESYAGHFLPALAHRILHPPALKLFKPKDVSINMKGIMMGNPIIDRRDEVNLASVYYEWGLIDAQGVEAVRPLQEKYAYAVQHDDIDTAYDSRNKLLDQLDQMVFQTQSYNMLKGDLRHEINDFEDFVTSKDIRDKLHTGSVRFTFSNSTVHTMLIRDFLVSLTEKVEELLEHYRVIIYCGQLDLTAPCVMNAEARRQKWFWKGRKAFLDAHRTPWWHGEEVAGYVKSGGNFTEVLIKNAGHLAPMDRPEEVFQLIDFFIRGLDIPTPPEYTDNNSDTPPHVPLSTSYSAGTNGGLLISIVLNVILVAVIVVGAVWWVRWKRRAETFLYSTVDNSSLDGVLTMN